MYLKIVVKQALYSSKKYHLPLEDTVQDGIVGIIIAIRKFDPEEHEKFSTYAPWWITQTINRLRRVPNNPMYFPVHVKDNLFMILEAIEEHVCEYCPENEALVCQNLVQQLSKKYGWTHDETIAYVNYNKQWLSLDEIDEESDKLSNEGMFEAELFDNIDLVDTVNVFMDYLRGFKTREQQVLLLRYGFTSKGEMTLEEVGNILGVTRERVRQIENKILKKLRVASGLAKKNRGI